MHLVLGSQGNDEFHDPRHTKIQIKTCSEQQGLG